MACSGVFHGPLPWEFGWLPPVGVFTDGPLLTFGQKVQLLPSLGSITVIAIAILLQVMRRPNAAPCVPCIGGQGKEDRIALRNGEMEGVQRLP